MNDHSQQAPVPPSRSRAWTGYAAAALAGSFALISFYWAAGGIALLDTLGGKFEERALRGESTLMALTWVAGALKGAGALFALALVQRWGRFFPRALMLLIGRGGAVLLIGYGGVQIVVQTLVAVGLVTPPVPIDWEALWWHLFIWDMTFLLWGVFHAMATRHYSTTSRRSGAPAAALSERHG